MRIVGHGVFSTPVGDGTTVRFCDARWQYSLKGYGNRTDVCVTVDGRTDVTPGATQWHYAINGGSRGCLDITPYAKDYNDSELWMSTGAVAILAAWDLLQPEEIVLHGFTAFDSGKHKPRVRHPGPGGRKAQTSFHDYEKEREFVRSRGVNFRCVP